MRPLSKERPILLVEDEGSVRTLVRSVLETAGFEVLTASSAEGAFELLGASPSPICLLLSDVVLPGMSGIELAKRIKCQYPKIGVILMSGYLNSCTVPPFCVFLQKPFMINTLLDQVKHALQ